MFRPEDLIGKQIDQFRLDRFIARGAMGIVYKAFDTVLARTVALKLISRQVTDGLSTQDINAQEEARKRLIQEAKAAGRLTHPNIITIHSYGESENFDYICMEYVTGKTLTQLLNVRKILPIEEAIPIIEQVLMALDAASREQIVHRDIKPSNIMITEDGRVKVMDFGIAKLPSLSMTTTGTVLGTPYYMSPEQISGQKLDSRSDIFSLGAVMYQVLTGERPFEAENTATLVYKIVQTEPIPAKIRNSSVSESVSNMIIKAMAKNPGQRYQTPREMLQALKAILSPGAGEVREESDATIIASGDEFEMTLQADKAALAPSPMGPGVSEVSTPPREELPPSPSEQKSSDQGAPSGVPGRSTEAQPGKGDTETVKRKGGVGPPAASKPATVTKATSSPPVTTKPKPSLPPKTTGLNRTVLGSIAVVLTIAVVGGLVLWRMGMWPFRNTPVTPTVSTSSSPQVSQQPAPKSEPAVTSVAFLLAEARGCMESDPTKAQRLLEQAASQDPRSFDAAMQLAHLLSARKDYSAAIRQYQRALQINDQSADAYFNVGNLYFVQGDHESAIRSLESCLALAPPYKDEVLTNLGVCYLKKNPSQAQLFFKQALELNPKNSAARNYLAGAPAELKMDVTQSTSTGVAGGPPLSASQQQGSVVQTKAAVESLLAQAKEQWDSDPTKAQKLLEQALSLDPNHFDAVMQLGRLLTVRKDLPAAIRQYQEALRINSQSAEVYFNLGYLYLIQGDYGSAIKHYEACLRLSPPYQDEVLTNLGVVYLKKNDLAQAQLFLKRALDLNSKNDLARNYLKAVEARTAGALTGGGSSAAQSTVTGLEGDYSVAGVNPDGSKYNGTAVIKRQGAEYVVNWEIAGKKHSGRGSLSGKILRVKWRTSSGQGGWVSYTLKPTGLLEGTWAGGRGTENLTRVP